MTNAVCESYNKTLIVINECRLRAISRNKTTLTMLANILRPLNDMFIRFQMLKRANGYKPWLMDYSGDVCRLMRKRYHPVATIILNVIANTTTFNHPCPFVVGATDLMYYQ
ncbi:uncharacterized protein Dvir_GJ26573 [Drosophila virilis]|uniref:Uncharacterized protein n=1 Tax=Drosophila virilis TaxID=7244 RepID=A0A0Q9WQ75_DROVI|nr:uncharacterized protein Dvir_GJ26573 [Drosophila virilis]